METRLVQLILRHASYDKPTNKQLQNIGIIEYFWQTFFTQAITRQDWEKSAVDLKNIIQEQCVDNFERRYTLTLLDKTVIQLQENSDNHEEILILIEGIKDWARKSVVRGVDIE